MEKTKETTKIVSAFAPVEIPPQLAKDPVSEIDIVDTLIIDTYEKDSEGNVKPITKQIVQGRKNRKEYIESFSDDVGLENILKKIGQGAIAEDKYSILTSNKQGEVRDLRPMQDVHNLGDIEALAAKAEYSFAHLDPELKKNMSFKQFVQNFGNDDLVTYVNGKVEKLKAAQTSKKEGENQ